MRWWCCLVVVCWSVALLGCSGGPAKQSVTGQVTLDGVPLAEGEITFVPFAKELRAEGARIQNGTYTVSIMPGNYFVQVRATKKVPLAPGEPSASGEKDKLVSIIPPWYNDTTILKGEITPSTTQLDYKLSTKK